MGRNPASGAPCNVLTKMEEKQVWKWGKGLFNEGLCELKWRYYKVADLNRISATIS